MNTERSRTHHHADRPDLAGEHKAGDAGQLVLLIVFLLVWSLDSFLLHYTDFLARSIAWYFRIIPGVMILVISFFLAWAGLNIVFGEKREKPELITKGVFSVVRHPIYLGAILLYLGLICMTFSLASAGLWVLIIVFYWLISRYEEKLLQDLFGPEYDTYRKKVPMLFPMIK
jgi:protein-S-isoprenylcysteine O-methyltransferase Ste14